MIVLSLFDGMSCGQIALRDMGIIPEVYYASEIDKFAIAQTQLNFPETIQLGSVTDVDATKLGHIDLMIGGSPCQSFSFAGKRVGMVTTDKEEIYTLERYLELKHGGFRFEGQSYLFWEYMRILNEVRQTNPDVLFLLENVEMGKKWEKVLSDAIGIQGVHINSALVSAQTRKRIYWTNIRTKKKDLLGEKVSDIPLPEDRNIFLKDILLDEVDEKYYLISQTIPEYYLYENNGTTLVKRPIQLNPSTESNGCQPYQQNRIYSDKGLSPSIMANMSCGSYAVFTEEQIRRLTPKECARLQTIPDWYKWECSETQQYKMLGNGWTVEVIKHIFSFLPIK